jgi:hypothetical protein
MWIPASRDCHLSLSQTAATGSRDFCIVELSKVERGRRKERTLVREKEVRKNGML